MPRDPATPAPRPRRYGLACPALLALALLAGCGERDAEPLDDVPSSASASERDDAPDTSPFAVAGNLEEERDPFDEDAARDVAEDELASDSYFGAGAPYGCTDDCSGHEAGYRFRADHGYVGFSPDSDSFNQGGQAFEEAVEDRVEEMRSDYESGGDPPY